MTSVHFAVIHNDWMVEERSPILVPFLLSVNSKHVSSRQDKCSYIAGYVIFYTWRIWTDVNDWTLIFSLFPQWKGTCSCTEIWNLVFNEAHAKQQAVFFISLFNSSVIWTATNKKKWTRWMKEVTLIMQPLLDLIFQSSNRFLLFFFKYSSINESNGGNPVVVEVLDEIVVLWRIWIRKIPCVFPIL